MKKLLYIVSVLTVIGFSDLQAQKPEMREVSGEAAIPKGSVVRIVGANRKMTIKGWDQAKVKVAVKFAYDSVTKYLDHEEAMERLGISIKAFSNRVDIVANRGANTLSLTPVVVQGYKKKTPSVAEQRAAEMVYVDELRVAATQGQNMRIPVRGSTTSATAGIQSLEIMVPTGSKLDIDNQYGDVIIAMNLDEAKLDISNGALDVQDVKNLELNAKYCNANFGSIEKAEIEFQNGTLHARTINDLDLDSKYSTIEYEKGNDLFMRSQADNITIDEIAKVDGRKTYGSIRIDVLNGNFDVDGINVDIKIRNINPQVELIKISNKYGDVRLPVRNLKNYFVDFTGYYSNVFTPFTKNIIKEDEKKAEENASQELVEIAVAGEYQRSSATIAGEIAPKRFTGTVGEVGGKHTRFQLTCHSCTVDFK